MEKEYILLKKAVNEERQINMQIIDNLKAVNQASSKKVKLLTEKLAEYDDKNRKDN